MICKNTYQFLISFKSAWRNNQVYFQTLRTKEVILLASLFKKLGIINKIDYVNKYMDWFSYVEYRDNSFKK